MRPLADRLQSAAGQPPRGVAVGRGLRAGPGAARRRPALPAAPQPGARLRRPQGHQLPAPDVAGELAGRPAPGRRAGGGGAFRPACRRFAPLPAGDSRAARPPWPWGASREEEPVPRLGASGALSACGQSAWTGAASAPEGSRAPSEEPLGVSPARACIALRLLSGWPGSGKAAGGGRGGAWAQPPDCCAEHLPAKLRALLAPAERPLSAPRWPLRLSHVSPPLSRSGHLERSPEEGEPLSHAARPGPLREGVALFSEPLASPASRKHPTQEALVTDGQGDGCS